MPATLWNYRESTPQDAPAVVLRGFSHQDRRVILPALDKAVEACGCWVLERRNLSDAQVELVLEVQLSGVFDLYTALVTAGVELNRASHAALTELCTLRRHHALGEAGVLLYGRMVTLGLEVNFVAEVEEDDAACSMAAAGVA